ncbi:Type IV prepilin peptidase TadV/CpaA [Rubellimicrobium mesophilum DSM 19309]|uniref:Type IV prepilin peptidase TadV/CpaA n=1 Tax=Rubellimicrobium mesophilum DSM 19309 TaxID=442562 RepID=A0A017HU46_9RHOB|nr:prepilin peptidase [Rubellimicrobium mesophilum]EYD77860.1 Type IV prepilin peptidase TadV/CpaA [Rubellimicrobium mesophilum DSM 19309]
MGTPPLVALAFLLGALAPCAWAAHADLSRMKIPNNAVLLLAAVFAVVGLACLPLEGWTLADWGWRWTHLVVVLILGMLLNGAGMMGAGDAKLLAAAAPFVALSDGILALTLFPAMLILCWAVHRLARLTTGPRLVPEWASWTSGRRFPMGVVIAATLLAYLLICATA